MDKLFQKYKISEIDNGVRLPEFKPSEEQLKYLGIKKSISNLDFLCELCKRGFDSKIIGKVGKDKYAEYYKRVDDEIEVIEALGFVDYILIIWDVCYFANKNKIPMGPGRGSVCSSLVCYLIGITEIDSIKHGTFFTRFLSKARAKSRIINGVKYIDGSLAPDIDQDGCFFRRQEIIDYITNKYKGRTCKLLTTSTFTSKLLIKDVAKCLDGITEEEANYASSLLEKEFGTPKSIEASLKENDNFKKWAVNYKETCRVAQEIEDLNRNMGQHASAILLSYDDISDIIPLQLSNTKEIISGYDMYSATELTLKLDELGLKTVSLIHDVCNRVGIKSQDIDIYDQCIYDYLKDFKNWYGIFQLESYAQGTIAKNIRPNCFKQIVDCLAISRPGASDYLGQYLDYVHRGIYKPMYPLIDDVLKETGSICLFQEQLLKMLNNLGMELDECEGLRKAIGKKLPEKVAEYKEKIYKICEENNHPKEVADMIWKIADDSAGYQFNISHATAYATLTCQTIYLKVKYPKEFFLALLKMAREEPNPTQQIARIQLELKEFGIKLLPPNILSKELDFYIDGDNIVFGLNAIKGIGQKVIERLSGFQHNFTNKLDIFKSAKDNEISIGVLNSLIGCGALDKVLGDADRPRMILEANLYGLLTGKNERKLAHEYGTEFNYNLSSIVKAMHAEKKNEKGKPLIKDSRRATLIRDYQPYLDIYNHNKKNPKFLYYFMEKTVLGYAYSSTLKDIFNPLCGDLVKIDEIKTSLENENVHLMAEVIQAKEGKSRQKKTPYLKLDVSDDTGNITVLMFENDKSSNISNCEENNGRLPKEGDIVAIRGNKKGDCIFARNIAIQDCKVYERISQLKKEEKPETKEKDLTNTPI